MNIKQFSELSGFSPDTLKYYEKIGLFKKVKRDSRGYRDYSEKEVAWAKFLCRLKSTGMSIDGMKYYAQLYSRGDTTIAERRKMLEEHQVKVLDNINRMTKTLEIINHKIALYKKREKK